VWRPWKEAKGARKEGYPKKIVQQCPSEVFFTQEGFVHGAAKQNRRSKGCEERKIEDGKIMAKCGPCTGAVLEKKVFSRQSGKGLDRQNERVGGVVQFGLAESEGAKKKKKKAPPKGLSEITNSENRTNGKKGGRESE